MNRFSTAILLSLTIIVSCQDKSKELAPKVSVLTAKAEQPITTKSTIDKIEETSEYKFRWVIGDAIS